MESIFENLTKLQISHWILDSFSFEAVDKFDNSLQTEFLDLNYDWGKNHFQTEWLRVSLGEAYGHLSTAARKS